MPVHATPAPYVVHLVGSGKLKVANGRLCWCLPGKSPQKLDATRLQTLLCYGHVSFTDDALGMLFENQVEVAWMSPGGRRCRGRLVAERGAGTNLRLMQMQILSSPGRIELARWIVDEKIASQRRFLRHEQRQAVVKHRGHLKQ